MHLLPLETARASCRFLAHTPSHSARCSATEQAQGSGGGGGGQAASTGWPGSDSARAPPTNATSAGGQPGCV
jgi:hypothetical protein